MRYGLVITASLFSACTFRAPRGIPLRMSGEIRADIRLQGTARVDTAVVPLQGAPVTEFFGIPLGGARDVLFVLDVSGSMAETAEGQIAMIAPPPPASGPADPSPQMTPPPTDAPPGEPAPGTAPQPPDSPAQPAGDSPGDPSSSVPPPMQPQPPPGQPPIATRVASKIEVAQAELIDAVSKLPAGTRMNILIFSNEVDAYAPTTIVLDETNRADVIAFVRDMRPDSATALQPALRMAFLLDAPRIVLLSDGLGNIGGNQDDIMRDVREAMRGGVRIDTIGIGHSQDANLLSTLASETGGLYQRL